MAKAIGRFIGRFFITLLVTILILVIGIYALMLVLTKGPSKKAGEIFVMSVRETSAIGFLANWFYTQDEIDEIVLKNSVTESDVITDTSLVTIATNDSQSVNEGDETPDIEVLDVHGATYTGKMMIVKDPSRVFVGVIPNFVEGDGWRVPAICDRYNAVGGINGGEFIDGAITYSGMPVGLVMSEGKIVHGDLYSVCHVTGFTNDNVLVVGYMNGQQALDMGMRDCVSINGSIGPTLILNGEMQEFGGTGGGLNPRTAIGQRADGAVILLAIDGRQANSIGASFGDCMSIMAEYGAVNASCMDGGTSTQMCYQKETINHPYSPFGARMCPTSFIVSEVQK